METPLPLKKRIGIIDLGSNSARLMVVQYTPHLAYRVTDEVSRRVRLSEGLAQDKKLKPAAMNRALETLRMFKTFSDMHGLQHLQAVATAAVRDAANRAEFLARAETEAGLKLRVLTGEEEAHYGVLGVMHGLGLRAGLVMDVGGGSAEVSEVRAGQFVRANTSTLGAVRLTEAFLPPARNGRVKPRDVAQLREHIAGVFQGIGWLRLTRGDSFAGVGGTARALARIDREMRQYPVGLLNGYQLELSRLEALIERLVALPMAERSRKIPGLPADRNDIILAGALVWAEALRQAGAKQLMVCGQGLRDGVFFKEFFQEATAPINLREFSVLNLGRLYGYEAQHVAHVAHLALSLFDQLTHWHGCGEPEREWLWAAAHLHDIGTLVDYSEHHKHSAYIIMNAGLPGFTHRELVFIAQLCLYHRKGRPDPGPYAEVLQAGDAQRLAQLAALLRLAEYLDRSRAQTVASLRVETPDRKHARCLVKPRPKADARVEVWETQRNADAFENAFNCQLEVQLA